MPVIVLVLVLGAASAAAAVPESCRGDATGADAVRRGVTTATVAVPHDFELCVAWSTTGGGGLPDVAVTTCFTPFDAGGGDGTHALLSPGVHTLRVFMAPPPPPPTAFAQGAPGPELGHGAGAVRGSPRVRRWS